MARAFRAAACRRQGQGQGLDPNPTHQAAKLPCVLFCFVVCSPQAKALYKRCPNLHIKFLAVLPLAAVRASGDAAASPPPFSQGTGTGMALLWLARGSLAPQHSFYSMHMLQLHPAQQRAACGGSHAILAAEAPP